MEVSSVEHIGPDADRLWTEVENGFGLTVVRDAAYLNWKFRAQPHMHHIIYEARRRGELRGLAVVRDCKPPEPNITILSELIAPREDLTTLQVLCRFVRHRHARPQSTIVTSTSVAEYRRAILGCGFSEVQDVRPVAPFLWSRRPGIDFARLGATMLLGRADSDWDQYPYGRVA